MATNASSAPALELTGRPAWSLFCDDGPWRRDAAGHNAARRPIYKKGSLCYRSMWSRFQVDTSSALSSRDGCRSGLKPGGFFSHQPP